MYIDNCKTCDKWVDGKCISKEGDVNTELNECTDYETSD